MHVIGERDGGAGVRGGCIGDRGLGVAHRRGRGNAADRERVGPGRGTETGNEDPVGRAQDGRPSDLGLQPAEVAVARNARQRKTCTGVYADAGIEGTSAQGGGDRGSGSAEAVPDGAAHTVGRTAKRCIVGREEGRITSYHATTSDTGSDETDVSLRLDNVREKY